MAIVMIHEAGHFVGAKAFGMKATEFFVGFGPRLWSFRRGETEYGLKAIPAGGYVRIIGMNPMEEVAPEEEHRTYRGKPFWQKSIVVMAGIGSHFVIAFVLIWIAVVALGRPVLGDPVPQVEAVTLEVDGAVTGASQAGLERGDLIVSIAGVAIAEWDDLTDAVRSRPGESVEIVFERDGQILTRTVSLTARVDASTGETFGFLGVSPQFPVVGRDRTNPIAGAGEAAVDVGTLTVDSFRGIGAFAANFADFVKGVFTGEELDEETRPISVVGVAQLGNTGQERGGYFFTLQLLAFFAVFTGILNAIPIYPFDGGHFAVALYEKIRGRHPDIRKLMPIAAGVFFLLLLLGVVTIFMDITNPLDLG